MAHRTFRDADGAEWHAWDTYPSVAAGRASVAAEYAGGWFAFERVHQPVGGQPVADTRRLAPVPPAWADLPEAALRALPTAATVVIPRHRGTPPVGTKAADGTAV